MGEDSKPGRRWRDIAEELCREQDNERLLQLADELIQVLEKQDVAPEPDRRRRA
jgi:hypothetical protein